MDKSWWQVRTELRLVPTRPGTRSWRLAAEGCGNRSSCRTVLHVSAVGLLAAILAIAPTARASAPPLLLRPEPHVVDTVLANGLAVTILADSAYPVVATQLWYHVGSANEPEGQRGLAHFLEHLVFHGTATHRQDELWLLHQRYGGSNNGFTSWDQTYYVSVLAPAGHGALLRIEADRMRNVSFDSVTVANEKTIVLEELRGGTRERPMDRLFDAARRAVLGRHPYALRPTGEEGDIERLAPEQVAAFYDEFYGPRNGHLVVVGPVDPEETFREVRELFGGLPPTGRTPADAPTLLDWPFPEEVSLTEDLPPANMAVLGYPLPPANSMDRGAVEILAAMLTRGELQPFKEEILTRRRAAVDAATVVQQARRGGALFFGSAVLTHTKKAHQFRDIEAGIQAMAGMGWLTDASVERTRKKLLRQRDQAAYFADRRAQQLATAAWWWGDARLALRHRECLAGVTRADVESAFRRYVLEAKPVRVYIRPARIPLYVRLFSRLYPLWQRIRGA